MARLPSSWHPHCAVSWRDHVSSRNPNITATVIAMIAIHPNIPRTRRYRNDYARWWWRTYAHYHLTLGRSYCHQKSENASKHNLFHHRCLPNPISIRSSKPTSPADFHVWELSLALKVSLARRCLLEPRHTAGYFRHPTSVAPLFTSIQGNS